MSSAPHTYGVQLVGEIRSLCLDRSLGDTAKMSGFGWTRVGTGEGELGPYPCPQGKRPYHVGRSPGGLGGPQATEGGIKPPRCEGPKSGLHGMGDL